MHLSKFTVALAVIGCSAPTFYDEDDPVVLAKEALHAGEHGKNARRHFHDLALLNSQSADLSAAKPVLESALRSPDIDIRHRAIATIGTIAARYAYAASTDYYGLPHPPSYMREPFYADLLPHLIGPATLGSPEQRTASVSHAVTIGFSMLHYPHTHLVPIDIAVRLGCDDPHPEVARQGCMELDSWGRLKEEYVAKSHVRPE